MFLPPTDVRRQLVKTLIDPRQWAYRGTRTKIEEMETGENVNPIQSIVGVGFKVVGGRL